MTTMSSFRGAVRRTKKLTDIVETDGRREKSDRKSSSCEQE